MSKTQLLTDTKNLLYFKGKTHYILIQIVTLHSTNPRTRLAPEMENNGVFSMLHFGDTFTISTLQLHKYIKDSQI